MKLWKGATFAFMLCGAALSTILIKNMATVRLNTKKSHTSSPSSRQSTSPESTSTSSSLSLSSTSSSSAESRTSGGLHRRIRSTDNMNSFLSELSMMFQSFTEGELRYVVETLLNKKRRRRSRRLGENQARRTRRAHRQSCRVKELELTVSKLGLGYESDETLVLRYCSGSCERHRLNYDMVMNHIFPTASKKKGKGPCCRPTAFEKDFSFLDNRNRYYTLQNVSAKHCGCV